MVSLWVGVTILCTLALGFIFWPLLSSKRVAVQQQVRPAGAAGQGHLGAELDDALEPIGAAEGQEIFGEAFDGTVSPRRHGAPGRTRTDTPCGTRF